MGNGQSNNGTPSTSGIGFYGGASTTSNAVAAPTTTDTNTGNSFGLSSSSNAPVNGAMPMAGTSVASAPTVSSSVFAPVASAGGVINTNSGEEMEQMMRQKKQRLYVNKQCILDTLLQQSDVMIDDVVMASVKCSQLQGTQQPLLKASGEQSLKYAWENFSDSANYNCGSLANLLVLFILILIIYYLWVRIEQTSTQ